MIEYYFAYGSNLNMDQMQWRCPTSEPVCKATIPNARMVFKTYADVIKTSGKKPSYVKGAIYKVKASDVAALDKYEGYPNFYKKVRVMALVDGTDDAMECFMYVMQPRVRKPALPHEEYFNIISQGYMDWNLPKAFLFKAWDVTAEKVDPTLRIGNSHKGVAR